MVDLQSKELVSPDKADGLPSLRKLDSQQTQFIQLSEALLGQNTTAQMQLQREHRFITVPLRRSATRALKKIVRSLPTPIRTFIRGAFYRTATLFAPNGDYAQRYSDYLRATRSNSLTPASTDGHLAKLLQPTNDNGLDIVVFPIIDWHFRIQRPQHIATELARAGNRIFYIATTFLPSGKSTAFKITESPEENIFLCKLSCPGPHPIIYSGTLSEAQRVCLTQALDSLLVSAGRRTTVALVGHAFWCDVATSIAGAAVIYDCMDYHAGFSNVSQAILAEEEKLLRHADAIVVSSQMLSDHVGRIAPNTVIRNAADVEFFSKKPITSTIVKNRPMVGYIGAISEWFDVELVAHAASNRPEWEFVLIGSSAGINATTLRKLANIKLLGELPYNALPDYVHSFDVCIIPFKLTSLVMHTNPVKIYEYLSAGKPVVATPLPELQLLEEGLIHLAVTEEDFLAKLDKAMQERSDLSLQEKRMKWATAHTWKNRTDAFRSIISACFTNIGLQQ